MARGALNPGHIQGHTEEEAVSEEDAGVPFDQLRRLRHHYSRVRVFQSYVEKSVEMISYYRHYVIPLCMETLIRLLYLLVALMQERNENTRLPGQERKMKPE